MCGSGVDAGLDEATDEGLVVWISKVIRDRLGHDGADLMDGCELLGGDLCEGLEGGKVLGKDFGSGDADMGDA